MVANQIYKQHLEKRLQRESDEYFDHVCGNPAEFDECLELLNIMNATRHELLEVARFLDESQYGLWWAEEALALN